MNKIWLTISILASSLLFGLTTALAIYGVSYFRSNGHLPTYDASNSGGHTALHDQEDYAFSTNPHDEDETREEGEYMHPHDADEEYHPSPPPHRQEPKPLGTLPIHTPTSPLGENFQDADTSYHGGGGQAYQQGPNAEGYGTSHANTSEFLGMQHPSRTRDEDPFRDYYEGHAHVDEEEEEEEGRVGFPQAPYNRL